MSPTAIPEAMIVAYHPWLPITLAALFGLLIGSFLNVVVYRLPLMLQRHWQREAEQFLQGDANLPHSSGDTFNLAVPASHCPHCHHAIRWWQNIPLLSYCLLAGRCRYCQAAIPLRYPLIELLTAASFAVLAWQLDNILALSLAGIFTAALLALAAIDIEHQLLLDAITLPLLWLGLIVNSFGLWVPLPAALWGAVGGYLSLWCVYWIYKLITGRDGIGFGDMKLLAALGAWLGWQALPAVIIFASLAGAVVGGGILLFTGGGRHRPLPFGPYLVAAGWVALLWGADINLAYIRWIGGW